MKKKVGVTKIVGINFPDDGWITITFCKRRTNLKSPKVSLHMCNGSRTASLHSLQLTAQPCVAFCDCSSARHQNPGLGP
uniref:Uncharacterized protein n=1 Tax=Romanomermis culicivorax TaxID=13658 RepID=A0A915JAD5_ROMCU